MNGAPGSAPQLARLTRGIDTIAPGLYFAKPRFTASNGTKSDWVFPVVVTAP